MGAIGRLSSGVAVRNESEAGGIVDRGSAKSNICHAHIVLNRSEVLYNRLTDLRKPEMYC